MPALSPLELLTPAQTAALQSLISLTGPLAQALDAGVLDDSGSTQQLPLAVPLADKNGKPVWPTMTAPQQNLALQAALIGFAAFMVAMNIQPPVEPPVVVTIPLAPITTGAGSLTFTNGILTSYISPT